MKIKNRILTALLTGILALSLVACGSAEKSDASEAVNTTEASEKTVGSDEAITIRIADNSYNSVPFKVGVKQGIIEDVLAEEGFPNVKVEIVNFLTGAEMVEAGQAGEVDFISCGDQMITTAIANGLDWKIIANDSLGNKIGLYARTDSGITSVADLKGKNVAVTLGTNYYLILKLLLEKNGLTEDDIILQNMSTADSYTAFLAGEVDASLFNASKAADIRDSESGVLLAYNGEVKPNVWCISASNEFTSAYPDLTVAFLKALDKATEYGNANEDDVIQAAVELADQDEDTVRYNYEESEYQVILSDTALDSIQLTLDFIYNSELVDHEVTLDEVVDTQWLEKAGLQ